MVHDAGGGGNGFDRDLGDMAVDNEREGMLVVDADDDEEELVMEVDVREEAFRRDKNDCLAGKTCRLVVDCDVPIEVGSGGTSSLLDSAAA